MWGHNRAEKNLAATLKGLEYTSIAFQQQRQR